MSVIVRATKDFAHPDSPHKTPADLDHALTVKAEVARGETRDVADVVLELGELPHVRCYPGELNQVFLNLIVNAARHHGHVERPRAGSPS